MLDLVIIQRKEREMSVFRVFKEDSAGVLNQFLGTKIAGERFAYAQRQHRASEVFEAFIFDLIKRQRCTIYYCPDENVGDEFVLQADRFKGKRVIFYTDNDGNDVPLKLRSEKDDPSDNKVNMILPYKEVTPDIPYLGEMVDFIMNPPATIAPPVTPRDKQAFLLGLLLLKRCR
jgi:hypothetical protein